MASKDLDLFLKFKYLKNHMIDLGDEQQYAIPSEPKAVPTARGEATIHVFDMEHVHKVALKDERPRIPKKQPGMSDAYHQKLCDKAYELAGSAKVFNDKVRGRVNHYASSGVLEVVEDPFAGEYEFEGVDPELAALVAQDTAAEREKTKKKPTNE